MQRIQCKRRAEMRSTRTSHCCCVQASHGGDSYIPLYWDLSGARDVFYARYIDWFVTVSTCKPGACLTPVNIQSIAALLATISLGAAQRSYLPNAAQLSLWLLTGAEWAVPAGRLQTPLLLLDVLLLASVPIGTALWVTFADVLMILFGLFGAITSHHYRCASLQAVGRP